jgi:hypothetical protein
MAEDTRHEMAKKPVVYKISSDVSVTRDVTYRATAEGTRLLDLYRPANAPPGARLPAVVIVLGFPGSRPSPVGTFKEMQWSIDWGRLLAATGVVGIFYTNRDPDADLDAVLDYVRARTATLGIDETRIGILATSGNVPLALSLLMRRGASLSCAALLYGFMLDLDGSTAVADAAVQWGFVNPAAGKSVADLPAALPLLVVRAGQDQFSGLNVMLDRFVTRALEVNLPVTVVNHATGPHSFDLLDDSDASRVAIKAVLAFLAEHLRADVCY